MDYKVSFWVEYMKGTIKEGDRHRATAFADYDVEDVMGKGEARQVAREALHEEFSVVRWKERSCVEVNDDQG